MERVPIEERGKQVSPTRLREPSRGAAHSVVQVEPGKLSIRVDLIEALQIVSMEKEVQASEVKQEDVTLGTVEDSDL